MQKRAHIALIGVPNVGKSSLINQIIGQKLTAVSHKPHTTRTPTLGVVNQDHVQLIFSDLPGIFNPKNDLEKYIVKEATQKIKNTDIFILIVDDRLLSDNIYILDNYQMILKLLPLDKIHIVMNKSDKLDSLNIDEEILIRLGLSKKKITYVSVKNNTGIDELMNSLKENAPQKPWLFDQDYYTDVSEKKLAEEITREKVFEYLAKEIPYSINVITDKWEERPDGGVNIYQSIVILKESQKKIVIGQGGSMLKTIGQAARHMIQIEFDRPISLFLYVKVRGDWIKKLK